MPKLTQYYFEVNEFSRKKLMAPNLIRICYYELFTVIIKYLKYDEKYMIILLIFNII